MTNLVIDLMDMYWLGDVNSTDPFLKVVDGFLKNPERSAPVFKNLQMYRELKPKTDTIEWTFFFHVSGA